MTVGRITQEPVEVLRSGTAKGRITQTVIEVLVSPIPDNLVVPITAQALVTADLSKTALDQFATDIVTSGALTADLKLPSFKSVIVATANVTGNITGIRQFIVSINASATLQADILGIANFAATISASGLIVANLRKNIEYLVAPISASGLVTAEINVPQHVGNTVVLTQVVGLDSVLSFSITDTLILTQTLGIVFFPNNLSASNTLIFTQNAVATRLLSTKTASNSLSLTQTVTGQREAINFLILTQSATATIAFLPGIASNTLSLTQQVVLDTVIIALVSNTLNLTQTVNKDSIGDKSASNTLIFTQLALGITLQAKTFVILQAPFEFIQTTVVLPNPLLDDTVNLVSNLTLRRNMNGSTYTYVKSNKNRLLKYTFTLDRLKALSLQDFLDAYNGSHIKVQNWKGEIWKVKLINNPVDFVQTRRYAPGSDRTDVNLEFEGIQING